MLTSDLHIIGDRGAGHELELYLDLICPFSRKQLNGVYEHLVPRIQNKTLDVKVILRQVPQPWHSSSTFVHEAMIGYGQTIIGKDQLQAKNDQSERARFQAAFKALMDSQDRFYDEPCAGESPNDTRDRLVTFLHDADGSIDAKSLRTRIAVGKGNAGTPATGDLKLAIKYARQNSVHVTPTVAFDGLIDGSISSSFGAAEWDKWLQDKGLVAK